jgi:hypothetical protein
VVYYYAVSDVEHSEKILDYISIYDVIFSLRKIIPPLSNIFIDFAGIVLLHFYIMQISILNIGVHSLLISCDNYSP